MTLQDLIDRARFAFLKDDAKTTWPDETRALLYARNALDWLFAERPDMFIGKFPYGGAQTLVIEGQLPVENPPAVTGMVYHVCGQAHAMDDEKATGGIAAGFFALAQQAIGK